MTKKLLIIDCDTPIVRGAAVCEDKYKVVHRATGQYAHYGSKKQFIKQHPNEDIEDYDFIEEPALKQSDNPEFKIEYRAMKSLKDFIEGLIALPWVGDFRIVMGGEGNFRNDVAVTWPYKGNRTGKPILTDFLKNYAKEKWPDKIIQRNGIEADDVLGHYGYRAYLKAKNKKDKMASDVVIAHLDKDINMIPGWHYNYDSGELYWVNEDDGLKFFFKQLLYGDKQVDFIPGLNSISSEIIEKFKIRKGKGVGEKSAEAIIAQCETVQDAFHAVVFCYKSCYPDTWEVYLQEQCDLLWMQRFEGSRFEVEKVLEYYGEEAKESS